MNADTVEKDVLRAEELLLIVRKHFLFHYEHVYVSTYKWQT